jgi:hypothetical protein
MATLRGTMVRLDGKLVIRYETANWSEPTRVIMYYPLSEDRSSGAPWRLEGRAVVSTGYGEWRGAPEDPDFWQLRNATAVALNGDKTEAVKVEREPIPCPKVRAGIQTRWHEGRWEKLMKKGWVAA